MRNLRSFCILCMIFSLFPVISQDTVRIEPISGYTDPSMNAPDIISRKHTGPVTSLAAIPGTDGFYAAGRDGFVSHFSADGFEQIWQLSELPILRIAVDPSGKLLATYESDGFSIHRVSVWNWEQKQRLYAKRFRDSVTALSWSARGTYLVTGHSSLEGISILDGQTGTLKPLFAQSPGMVSLAVTGSSENSIVTFGPSGTIRYTDLRNGEERASYQGERDLSDPRLIANNLRIIGFDGTTLYSIDATTGNTIERYETRKPVIASHSEDEEPRWFDYSGNGLLFKTGNNESVDILGVSSPICAAASLETRIIAGTKSGALYSIPRQKSYTKSITATPLAAEDIHRVDALATDGSRLYILSKGSVFMTTDADNIPQYLFSGMSTSNSMTCSDEGLLFWSSERPASVILASFDGTTRTVLHEAHDRISSLSLYGNYVSCIVGGSTAVVFDLDRHMKPFTYSGAGLQDAVLVNSEQLLISKSSTGLSPHVLLSINTRTGETVPVPVEGHLVYGLSRSFGESNTLYAFRILDAKTTRTDIVSFDVDPSDIAHTGIRILAQYGDEDTAASLIAQSGHILTTLGKSTMIELTIRNSRQIALERNYALPKKPLYLNQYIVSLNQDGSVSWYNRAKRTYLETGYLASTGHWVFN